MTADARVIRVFHVLGSLITGGAERLVLDLCRFAPLNAIDPTIVSLGPPQGHVFEQAAADQGIRVIYLDKPPGLHPPVIATLYRLFRMEQPDVVHTHAYLLPYALPAMFLNRLPGRVHTIHNLADKEAGYVIRRIMALAYRFLGVTPVAISHQVKASIMAEYALESARIPCIHNGIDTLSFKRTPRRPHPLRACGPHEPTEEPRVVDRGVRRRGVNQSGYHAASGWRRGTQAGHPGANPGPGLRAMDPT